MFGKKREEPEQTELQRVSHAADHWQRECAKANVQLNALIQSREQQEKEIADKQAALAVEKEKLAVARQWFEEQRAAYKQKESEALLQARREAASEVSALKEALQQSAADRETFETIEKEMRALCKRFDVIEIKLNEFGTRIEILVKAKEEIEIPLQEKSENIEGQENPSSEAEQDVFIKIH